MTTNSKSVPKIVKACGCWYPIALGQTVVNPDYPGKPWSRVTSEFPSLSYTWEWIEIKVGKELKDFVLVDRYFENFKKWMVAWPSKDFPHTTWYPSMKTTKEIQDMMKTNMEQWITTMIPSMLSQEIKDHIALVNRKEIGDICRHWEEDPYIPTEILDTIKINYCDVNPERPECSCLSRVAVDPAYVLLKPYMSVPDKCWYLPCSSGPSSSTGVLMTTDIDNQDCPDEICGALSEALRKSTVHASDIANNTICVLDDDGNVSIEAEKLKSKGSKKTVYALVNTANMGTTTENSSIQKNGLFQMAVFLIIAGAIAFYFIRKK